MKEIIKIINGITIPNSETAVIAGKMNIDIITSPQVVRQYSFLFCVFCNRHKQVSIQEMKKNKRLTFQEDPKIPAYLYSLNKNCDFVDN